MKTGLVTFYHIHHYGALLQAYATERAVEALRAGDEPAAEAALAEQRAFVRAHLLNWVPAFVRDMKASAESGFYAHLATFTEAYLAADAEALAEVVGD